jgi:hypothetical protein
MAVMVVEGRSRTSSAARAEDLALDDAFQNALEQLVSQMADPEAVKIRGALVERRLTPYLHGLIRKYTVLDRETSGDELRLRVSVDVDIMQVKSQLRRDGFFRGQDFSRVLCLIGERTAGDVRFWWGESPDPVSASVRAVEQELEKGFFSKGFIFVKGDELGLMDFMPPPLRTLKLSEAQLRDLGRLFEVEFIFTGEVSSQDVQLKMFSVGDGKFISQSSERGPASDSAPKVVSNLVQQIEDKWTTGGKESPFLLIRIAPVRAPGEYMALRDLLSKQKEMVVAVSEYEQSAGEVTFRVEVKVDPRTFVQQLGVLRQAGLEVTKQVQPRAPQDPLLVDMKWEKSP